MRMLRIGFTAAALLSLLLGSAQAVRVALAPAPALDGKSTDDQVFCAAAALWLHERLEQTPGVELMPEPRNTALFLEVNGGAWSFSDPNLQPRYSLYEPVDAVISFASEAGAVRLFVDSAAGRKSFTPASSARAALLKELGKSAAFLSQALALPPAAASALGTLPDLDGESFAALCQAQQTSAQWPRNPGEARLILLQPGWKKNPVSPRLCAGILRAAALQLSSKNRDSGYNPTALTMARMALPPVLGTPFEEAAVDLAKAAPAEMIPELTTIAGGLLKESSGGKVGAALDDLLTAKETPESAEPGPAAGGAWASGVFTRPQMLGAVRVLARVPGKEAQAILAKLESHPDAEVQKEVREGRAAAPSAPAPVTLPADLPRERLIQLANDPDSATAQAALLRLAAQRPAGEAEAAAFDLLTAHPASRLRLLESLSAARPAWGEPVMAEAAAANPDPYVRAEALLRLAAWAPATARPLAIKALQGDGHKWLRLHAANVLADTAEKADESALRSLQKEAQEPAVKAFLTAALAKATGGPAPEKGQGARLVGGSRNLAWICGGTGAYAVESPFDAYYCLSVPTNRIDWKRGYDAGKIYFVRISTVGHPGMIALSRQYRDRFWLDIERALPADVLPLVDGLVFGEETMSMAPDGLWKEGWRLFCDDVKIDASRVAGDQEKLTVPERQAWQTWAYDRAVDGFNTLHDYVKTRYALERPGLQVCTFLTGEPSTPGLRRWKFDVAGIYDYKCDSRLSAYSLVRRIKTLWPERPVIWLSLGIGGYEMNPVKRNLQVPAQPMSTRRIRCYADAVAAWMAGADTGWFSVWMFVDPRFSGNRFEMGGVQVNLEDIGRDSPLLRRGVALAFKGAEAEMTDPTAPKKPEGAADLTAGDKGNDPELAGLADLVQGRDTAAESKAAIEQRKEAFSRGFLFYQQYVYDCARVFKSLPRLPPRQYSALAVYPGATVWVTPPTPNPVVPGMALLNAFDFLSDLKEAAQLDLSSYRIIMVRDPGPLPASVMEALTAWLTKTEGLLYIQGGFDSEAEWGGPGNLSGKLKESWPWAQEVRVARTPGVAGKMLKPLTLTGKGGEVSVKGGQIACTFTLSGERAQALLGTSSGPVLALWSDPGRFKGVVAFDGVENASRDYVGALRGRLGEAGGPAVAALLAGPVLHETEAAAGVTAAAAPGYYKDVSDQRAYAGLDLLTGERDPTVGGGLSGALAATNFAAGHVAVMNGIALLAERIPLRVEPAEGGLMFRGGGLVRLASAGGLKVAAREGAPLPVMTNAAVWVVEGAGEGLAEIRAGTNAPVLYVRSEREVVVTTGRLP